MGWIEKRKEGFACVLKNKKKILENRAGCSFFSFSNT